MNPLRKAIRAAAMSVCLGLPLATAEAGIIDDGANDADHLSLANLPQYDAVGLIKRLNDQSQLVIDSSGVLLGDGTWVLTAAHTVPANGRPGSTFELAGQARNVINAIQHPNFTGDIEDGWDIALLRLAAPITNVSPAELYTGSAASLVGQTLTYVGYGKFGTGSVGVTGPPGTKRAGNNMGDQLGFTLNPGADEVAYSNQVLFADMDDPPGGGQFGNPLGNTNPIGLEYLIAVGDSGGGLFVEDNGQYLLAGIHSVVFDFDPAGTFGYGDIMGSTTLAAALSWILDTMSPEPVPGDLNGDGFVGIDDLNIVLSLWNLSVVPGDLDLGDPSGDGFVGIEDLNIVLGNWNAGSPPSAGDLNALTPEPGTLMVLAAAGAGLLIRRRH